MWFNHWRKQAMKKIKKHKNRQSRRRKGLLIGAVVLGVAIGILFLKPPLSIENQEPGRLPPLEKTTKEADQTQPTEAKLFVGGDIVFHPITYSPEYEKVVEPYDFTYMFRRLSNYTEKADFSTITFETVCDPDKDYNGFPLFNTPPQSITDIHEAGFDAFSTATNHCLDAGFKGMKKTLEKMDDVGVKHFGTKRSADQSILITDVKGIKIAFLNYADAYNGLDEALTSEQRKLISPLEIDKVCKDIKKARDLGADIVAVYPHWGIEYQTLPNETQIAWAHKMAKSGADLILGSHPHVMQPPEWVENNGHKTYIVYSLGNAMSNQREKFLGTIDTEIGAFADITLEKNKDGARVKQVKLLPSTVYVHREAGKLRYEAAIIDDLLNGKYKEELSDSDRKHIARLEKRADEILSGKIVHDE